MRTGRALADALQDLRDARLEADLACRRAADLAHATEAAERTRDEAVRSRDDLQVALSRARGRLRALGDDEADTPATGAAAGGPADGGATTGSAR